MLTILSTTLFSFIGGGEGTHTPLFSNGADYILELNNYN
jgi:hypothetical protein